MKKPNSASQFVLIMVSATACIGFLFGILQEEKFMYVATGVLSYYFTKSIPSGKT